MARTLNDRLMPGWLRSALHCGATALLVAACMPASLDGQTARRIIANNFALSGDEATMELEFDGGGKVSLAIRDGRILVNGDDVGPAPRGGALDRAWRELLVEAMEAPTEALPELFIEWDAPEGDFDARIEALLARITAPALAPAAPEAPEFSDSVDRLVGRISDLQEMVDELESGATTITIPDFRVEQYKPSPFRHLIRGFEGLFSVSVLYAVLFGIAFATIFFGGRRFIEGVADTARTATTRSLLVGLAATFLVIPAYILGMIALGISIVGILALPVWILLFPVAAALAVLLGYIGVAHAAGESLAERRFYATDWFRRGNSYYFLLTGLGLMLVLFAAGNIVGMAGPWLGILRGLLFTVAGVVTWAALSIGLGAVLLSRGGTRPMRGSASAPEPGIYAEETDA